MQRAFNKDQNFAGLKTVSSAFSGSVFLSVLILLANSFYSAHTAVQPTPTQAADPYSVGTNEFVDGESEVLIYDTGVVVGDEVDFDGQNIFIKGNVYFKAQSGETLHVNIGETTASSYVSIQPFANRTVQLGTALTTETHPVLFAHEQTNDDIESTRDYGHLCFCPDAGGTIEVNLFKDLYLTGSNYGQEGEVNIQGFDGSGGALTIGSDDNSTDLTMSFTGDGQTIFKFADGKALIMDSAKWDTVNDVHIFTDMRPGVNTGVRAFVAMDQNKNAVVTEGKNKVVFQRIDYNGGDQNTIVRVGRNSFWTYVSNNIDGLDTTAESYAGVAFDVSNTGEGRFELQITGSDSEGSYVDGSMQICSSFLGYIDDTDPENPTPVPAVDYTNPFDFTGLDPLTRRNDFGETTWTGIDYSQPAGSQAFLRIVDNLAYASDSDYRDALDPVSGEVGFKTGGAYTRRGLLIVNNNFSIPPFASNPYGDAGWFNINGPVDGVNKVLPYRPGCILGVNGHVEVNHNTFIEYEALSPNIEIDPPNNGFTELDTKLTNAGITDPGTVLKKHNPSAFIMDGLETILRFEHPISMATIDPPVPLVHFQAHLDENIVRHGQMSLYGNASFTCHAPLLTNQGTYDGFRVPVPDELDGQGQVVTFGETPGEGVYVMDIEGFSSVRTIDDDNVVDPDGIGWHAGTNRTKEGVFRLGSIFRTFDDREAQSHLDLVPVFTTRPLTEGALYSRYDKPTIFTNASFDFIDLDFHNEDITRDVIPDPLQADPIIVGGEKATFRADVELNPNPDITFWRIYNTRIHCHESMCISGTRILVRELPSFQTGTGEEGSNTSQIILYNHGFALDVNKKGHGRVFMFGTNNNEVAAGGTSNFLDSAYANIFRHTGHTAATGTTDTFKNRDAVLKLQTAAEVPAGVNTDEKSMHIMLLGNASYMDVGWTSTQGMIKDAFDITIYPFDHFPIQSVSQANQFLLKTDSTNDDGSTDDGEKPAELNIDGDFIFFGAKGPNGEASPRTVDQFNLGRVLYVGHGGKFSIGSDTSGATPRPYIGFSEATVATRVWKNKDGERGLNATLDLPGDQMKLTNPIHPYDIDLNVVTDVDQPHLSFRALAGQGLGSEVRIAWDKVVKIPIPPTAALPIQTILGSYSNFVGTRAITTLTDPVPMPASGLVFMGSGDSVDQLTVSGATPANPFQFYMTGDENGIAQIREVASVASGTLVPGEGDYAKMYLDGGSRLGLGTRHWNNESLGAWNRVGLSQILLHPNGDCKVDVNADLIAFDPQPLVPTENFGSQYEDTVNNVVVSPEHRVTFFAHDSRELRIPAGQELDLSAFGQAKELTAGDITGSATPVDLPPFTQQIAAGGKLRLIFEPGSTLRFPDLGDLQAAVGEPAKTAAADLLAKMPVLYMNEESELIFEAIQDLENKPSWTDIAQTDRAKIRIIGCGQIWLNKHAKMRINDGAIVGVEADAQTPNTNVTISIQREGIMGIGDLNNPGGSFQVGNPADVAGTNIDFTLRLNGEASELLVGRNGFLGLGAGTVDRDSTRVNNWTLAPLFNVRDIAVRNIKGVISHNRIFDGSDREASLMAMGPASGTFLMEHGPTDAVIRGGGNIVYVRPDAATVPFAISIGSTVEALTEDVNDNGRYTILNPSLNMKQILTPPTGSKIDTIVQPITQANSENPAGTVDPDVKKLNFLKTTSGDVASLINGIRFQSGQVDFYKYFSSGGINEVLVQKPSRYVALGQTKFEERVGFVKGGQITRSDGIAMQTGTKATDGLELGTLRVATSDESANPTSFIPPER